MTFPDFQASGGTVVGDIAVAVDNPGSANPVVESTGTVPYSGTQNITKILRVVLQSEGSPPLFDYGIFGNTSVTLANNALINSYDSELGAYGGANIHQNGNTGTNATGYGGITLGNNAVIQGLANSGYQSDPNQVIVQGHGSEITGEKAALDAAKEMPSVPPPTGLPSRGNLTASGTGTTISQSGQYNNFSLNINARVTVTADVTLYITGTFTLNNNAEFRVNPGCSVTLYFGGNWNINNNSRINNITTDPASLVMYGTDTFTGTKTFCNNTVTYAAIYFPRADIILSNNGAIFGSIVANSIYQNNNAPIHYDEALGDLESDLGTNSSFSVKSWQEIIQ
jgi:hypothetical protein